MVVAVAHVPNGTQHLEADSLLLLDMIYRYQARIDFYRADADLTDCNYSRISAIAMRRVIDKNRLPNVIERLVKAGIIEIDHSYKVGERPKGYRLTKKYAARQTLRVPIDGRYGRRLKRALAYEREPRNAVQRKLNAWLGLIDIDMGRVEELLKEVEEPLVEQFRHLAELVRDGVFFFTCDGFGERVHTNISNFPKALRPALSCNGQPLINVDIACSQPFFLATVLLKEQQNRQKLANLSQSSQTTTSLSPSLFDVHFAQRACDGTLYDLMPSPKREKNKEAVFSVMFCRVHKRLTWQERIFREAFLLTFEACNSIKSARRDDKDGYKDLARILQQSESSLMIDGVCAEIIKARPEAPLFTIHDSIMTTEPHVDFVHDTIVRLASVSGLTPKVRKGDD